MSHEIESPQHIAIFKGKKIRKVIHEDQWYFSIIDVIELLTESANPRRYWSDLKRKLIENEGFSQLYDKIVQLKLVANDGKMRETETADTETMFRIIQSIPSPKVEPFKRWLAKVGYERIQELKIPSLLLKEYVRLTRLKDIRMIGLKSGCVELRSERRLQMSGNKEALKSSANMQS